MIPKIIHYCWFGGNPMSPLACKCIASWKKYCPDYEIKEWNESNFDVDICDYTKEAYEAKKWAFITDYVRVKTLFECGGIYMDTDVELCKPPDPFLKDSAFSGFENKNFVPTGIMASEKGHPFFLELLSYYDCRHFKLEDGSYDLQTNTTTITKIALEKGLVLNNQLQNVYGMTYYPDEYFCPKSYDTGKLLITEKTVCIHHFDGSWRKKKDRKAMPVFHFCNRYLGCFGETVFKIYKYALHPKDLVQRIKEKRREWRK